MANPPPPPPFSPTPKQHRAWKLHEREGRGIADLGLDPQHRDVHTAVINAGGRVHLGPHHALQEAQLASADLGNAQVATDAQDLLSNFQGQLGGGKAKVSFTKFLVGFKKHQTMRHWHS